MVGATKVGGQNYWAWALEPASNYWAHALQPLRLPAPRACAPEWKEATAVRGQCAGKSKPYLLQLEKGHEVTNTVQPKIKI